MKRSQMHKKLMDAIKHHEEITSTYNQLASLVLAVIEDEGMSPPLYLGVMPDGKQYNYQTDYGKDTAGFRQWEPE